LKSTYVLLNRWEALILVMDGKPFEDLPYILQRVNDDRVWMYADYVGQQFAPKVNGEFQIMYHEKLYNLTDDAIRACPRSSRWVVITNGDNLYANTFFERCDVSSALCPWKAMGDGIDRSGPVATAPVSRF
jgi:hypothetical protein